MNKKAKYSPPAIQNAAPPPPKPLRRHAHSAHAWRVTVFGVVQGVGFRPFVYRLAHRHQLRGWVKNIGYGVSLHLESDDSASLDRFLAALDAEKPPLALIESIKVEPTRPRGLGHFRILKSRRGESFVFISPDISTCSACLAEVSNPAERRYRYPFTNCTDCGPRYTIVKSLPYDRDKTTMAGFAMCPECRREYEDPLDRRYHSQPIACPRCGPTLELKNTRPRPHSPLDKRPGALSPAPSTTPPGTPSISTPCPTTPPLAIPLDVTPGQPAAKSFGPTVDLALATAIDLIRRGKILAVKGLGGFHLVCDPHNPRAVARLRRLKHRKTKPLALMARDIETIEKYAFVSEPEKRELLSASRPIVLLRKKRDIPGIAPRLNEMGFMLPYTPLHHLLLAELGLIVATSSNPKDAPIVKDETEGMACLADSILTHNRPIESRSDDSVLKVVAGSPLFLRRARGYVPYPQRVPAELCLPRQVMALGAELKDTISIYKNGYVITSQFLGDLDEYQNFLYFEETIDHLRRLFSFEPELLVCDLHPDFHTTRYARRSGLPFFQVQHHYAHVLAVLLEHNFPLAEKVIGISLDGYGYGQDGGAWGGEFLLADYTSFTRIARFREVPLPGADQAARQPWRMALAYLQDAFGSGSSSSSSPGSSSASGSPSGLSDGSSSAFSSRSTSTSSSYLRSPAALPRLDALEKIDPARRRQILRMMEARVRSPLTSSCGRLFDAVSFLTGVAPLEVEFEAEAPMRLEALADDTRHFASSSPAASTRARPRTRAKLQIKSPYPFSLDRSSLPWELSFAPMIRAIVADLQRGASSSTMATRFHSSLARAIATVARKASTIFGPKTIVLTGGVFLNRKLLEAVTALLEQAGLTVLRSIRYSPNDESISLGQVAHALARLKKEGFPR